MSYKRVVITKFGGPDVLQVVEEAALPEPQPGEVRIKVLATSAAFTDTMIRKGIYPGTRGKKPPFSPGYDLVGVVDKLGEGVTKLKIGQKVAELTVIGAYAEYICLHEDRLVPVPDELDAAEAVSMILTYITAYQMMHRLAHIHKGQRILVHGAGGAVGTALLQLGKTLDLEMYGTGSTSKQDLIASLGATPIDYRTEDFVERIRHLTGAGGDGGVDAAFDCINGKTFNGSFSLLKTGGTLVWYGMQLNSMWETLPLPFDMARLYLRTWFSNTRSTKFYSIAPWREDHADWFHEDLTALFGLLSQGKLNPVIDRRMSLDEAAHAHELIEQAAVKGKIVLVMNDQ
ncbi:MAG: medium chain dehydrogenase/reductase family protein [Chloroflexota bacterium]